MNEDKARNSSFPPLSAESLVRFLRCWGRKPSGPPADPQGKDFMALATSFSVTSASSVGDSDAGGKFESGWAGRGFALSSDKVSWLITAMESSEQAIRTAPV